MASTLKKIKRKKKKKKKKKTQARCKSEKVKKHVR